MLNELRPAGVEPVPKERRAYTRDDYARWGREGHKRRAENLASGRAAVEDVGFTGFTARQKYLKQKQLRQGVGGRVRFQPSLQQMVDYGEFLKAAQKAGCATSDLWWPKVSYFTWVPMGWGSGLRPLTCGGRKRRILHGSLWGGSLV